MSQRKMDTRYFVLLAMFLSIEIILAFVPNLGFITTPWLNITTMHIPVIIGGALLGVKGGAFLGFSFGAASFINATFLKPNPIESPLFTPFYSNPAFPSSPWSLVICFVPRILVGVLAALTYRFLEERLSSRLIAFVLAGIVGSLTNTVLVLSGIYLFFGQAFASAAGISPGDIIASIVGLNGLLEAGIAAFLTAAIGMPVSKVKSQQF